ncbi:MAG: DUF6491 family protein [Pseudomonadales bacterium]
MRVLMVLSLLALSACASAPEREASEAQAAAREEAIQDILTTPLAAEDYVESERCLSTYTYRSVDVLDDRNVLFKGPGDRAWINQLRHRCIGLRRNDTLQFELRDNRLCELDSFESVDTLFRVWSRTSATCTLGKFQPVTPEQVEALRAAVREDRRNR